MSKPVIPVYTVLSVSNLRAMLAQAERLSLGNPSADSSCVVITGEVIATHDGPRGSQLALVSALNPTMTNCLTGASERLAYV